MAKRKPNYRSATESKPRPDPVGDERKRLLKRIRKLHRRINQLRLRHNSLAPINRLPPEVLSRIFFSLQSKFRRSSPPKYYRWTAVTHVCQFWRTITFGNPLLWNVISYTTAATKSPWVSASLERSHPLPINVVVTFDSTGEKFDFLDAIAEQHQRMHTLTIRFIGQGGHMGMHHLLDFLAKLKAPVLEEFECKGTNQLGRHREHRPITLFGSHSPRLKSLQIRDMEIILKSVPFDGITTLKLTSQPGNQKVLSFRALFDFLRTTRLHTLVLQHTLFKWNKVDEVHYPASLPLHFLSSLDLQLSAPKCIKLLSHIIIPLSCCSSISGSITHLGSSNSNSSSGYTPQTFFDAVLPHFSLDLAEFTKLGISTDKKSICLELFRTNHPSLTISSMSSKGTITGGANPGLPSFPSLSRFSEIWSVWTTESDSALDQGHIYPESLVKEVASELMKLPSLSHLYLAVPFLTPFSKHLFKKTKSLKKLKNIVIKSVNQDPTLFEELERALVKRKEAGRKAISVLKLSGRRGWIDKDPVPAIVERLRVLVSTVRISEY